MGLDVAIARFLSHAAVKGRVNFSRTATLGRQDCFVTESELHRILGNWHFLRRPEITDGFFEAIGCGSVDAIEYRNGPGITKACDLNYPVESTWHRAYSAVVDMGTLEHVWNYPQALANAMNMVEVGGSIVICTPANGYGGHGFYQISPEALFRAFWKARFWPVCAAVCVHGMRERWYRVTDPREARARALITGLWPTMLFAVGQRIDSRPVFLDGGIIQSDYEAQWFGAPSLEQCGYLDALSHHRFARAKAFLLRRFPRFSRFLERLRLSPLNPALGVRNRRCFTPTRIEDLFRICPYPSDLLRAQDAQRIAIAYNRRHP